MNTIPKLIRPHLISCNFETQTITYKRKNRENAPGHSVWGLEFSISLLFKLLIFAMIPWGFIFHKIFNERFLIWDGYDSPERKNTDSKHHMSGYNDDQIPRRKSLSERILEFKHRKLTEDNLGKNIHFFSLLLFSLNFAWKFFCNSKSFWVYVVVYLLCLWKIWRPLFCDFLHFCV